MKIILARAIPFWLLTLSLPVLSESTLPPPIIDPALDRREIVVPRIDSEDFELTLYGGLLSVEDFGSHALVGARGAFHVTETLFVEASYGSSEASDAAFRDKGLTIFPSEVEPLTFYSLSFGLNFFPGEIFIGANRAMASSVYLVAGAGNTDFIGNRHFTSHLGLGIRILPRDWLSVRFDMRDHMFENDILGRSKLTHNFEMSLGFGLFF